MTPWVHDLLNAKGLLGVVVFWGILCSFAFIGYLSIRSLRWFRSPFRNTALSLPDSWGSFDFGIHEWHKTLHNVWMHPTRYYRKLRSQCEELKDNGPALRRLLDRQHDLQRAFIAVHEPIGIDIDCQVIILSGLVRRAQRGADDTPVVEPPLKKKPKPRKPKVPKTLSRYDRLTRD